MASQPTTPPTVQPITQKIMELCIHTAQVAKDLAIAINGDAARATLIDGMGNSYPGNAEHTILNNTLSSAIGGKIFDRCLDGQPMQFSSKPRGR